MVSVRCLCYIYITYAGEQFGREEPEGLRGPLVKVYALLYSDKNNPEALSQLYKMMNYKPTSNKGEKLTTEQVANFLKVNKKEGDNYDDIMYYDDAKIKVTATPCRNWSSGRPSSSRRATSTPRSTSRPSKSTTSTTRPSTIRSRLCSIDQITTTSFNCSITLPLTIHTTAERNEIGWFSVEYQRK